MDEEQDRGGARPSYEAEYVAEGPVRCPGCKQDIESIQVVRLLRAQVNFTSTLPRRGYVAVCPRCRTVLPAELKGGLV